MANSLPTTTVIRISRGNFDPTHYSQIVRMATDTSSYLIPAIRELDGLLAYYAGVSADGSTVHVSIWDSEEHA